MVFKRIKDATRAVIQKEENEKELKELLSKVVKCKKNLAAVKLKVEEKHKELRQKESQLISVSEELQIKEQLLEKVSNEIEEKNKESNQLDILILKKKVELRKLKVKKGEYTEKSVHEFIEQNKTILTKVKSFTDVLRNYANKTEQEEQEEQEEIVRQRLELKAQYRKEDVEFERLFQNFVELHDVLAIIDSNADELLLALVKGDEKAGNITCAFYQKEYWVKEFYRDLFEPFLHMLQNKNYQVKGKEEYLVLTLKEKALLKNFRQQSDDFIPMFHLSPENHSVVDVIHKYIELVGENKINLLINLGFLGIFLIEKGFIGHYKGTSELHTQVLEEMKSYKAKQLEVSLTQDTNKKDKKKMITIEDIDLLSGEEFERYLAELLNNLGFRTELTKGSGDQGVDILAFKQNKKYVIQAKRYNRTVGTKAVQEVVAGKAFYNADESWVITNSTYTKGAIDLAQKTDTKLWDRDKLKNMMKAIIV
ncbi:restriction endonuclease [Bacillus paramycoides]|uniref:restriction endonuclease n=1 Tax=Bacillus paramycoides TaxID=2026194 RepID=UPI003D0530A8